MIKLTDILFEGKLSKSQIKKMRDKFDKTVKLPPHLQKLADLMDKHKVLFQNKGLHLYHNEIQYFLLFLFLSSYY